MCDKNPNLNRTNREDNKQFSCDCPGARMSRYFQPFALLLLMDKPSHGYDLLNELAKLCPEEDIDPGSLYKNLRKMEEDGLVTSDWDTGNPGPARRIYKITEMGQEVLQGWGLAIKRNKETLEWFLDRYGELSSKAKPTKKKKSK
jgi:poly-beta-hydroxybutyrate-responsive repressor